MTTTKQSIVKQFFKFPEDIEIGANTKFKAKCTECGRDVAGYGKTTSDFIKHMKVRQNVLTMWF